MDQDVQKILNRLNIKQDFQRNSHEGERMKII